MFVKNLDSLNINKIYIKLNKSDEFQCNPYKSFHNNAEIIMSCLRLFRHIQHVEIPAIQTIIDSCNNTTENRIQYIVDEISKDDFQAEIIAKDIRRKKHIDGNSQVKVNAVLKEI